MVLTVQVCRGLGSGQAVWTTVLTTRSTVEAERKGAIEVRKNDGLRGGARQQVRILVSA